MLQLIEYLLYGIISGLSGILPVSSEAHQNMLLSLLGKEHMLPLCDFMIDIALLACVMFCTRDLLNHYIQERSIRMRVRKRRGKRVFLSNSLDFRIVTTAAVPMILVYMIGRRFSESLYAPLAMTATLVFNGLLLIIPDHIRQGNKEAKHMTGFDSIYFGFLSGLSCIPGISRIAAGTCAASTRGADKQKALTWVLLLSIPALAMAGVIDLFAVFSAGFSYSVSDIIMCLSSAVAAFACGYGGILLLRFLSVNAGYSWFAYYSWGAAIFYFVLYLIN